MSVRYGIVLGCPRSGTTYLMSVLNAIPDLECLDGTLMPVTIPHVATQALDAEVYDALAVGFERALDAYLHSGRYHSRAAALQKWVRAPSGLGDLVKALRGRRDLPERMIYKEPFLAFAPDFVLDALPDAQIVYLVRDGRDCARSLVENYDVLTDEKLTHLRSAEVRMGREYDHRYVPWWVGEGREQAFIESSPYVRAVWMWKEMVRRCHECFSRPTSQDNGQVMRLHYEEFVRAPFEYGSAVLEHFGAAPNTASWYRLRQAHTRSIGKYARRSDREIRAAEEIAGEELSMHGYELHTSAE